MTEGIGSNFQSIGHVTTTKWKEKPKGENNDCYWNIAQNSLEAGASNEEIARVMNELIELNAEKDENGDYNTVLSDNKKILMPLDQTIKQANTAIKETFENYQQALNSYQSAIDSFDNSDESKQALEKTKEDIKSQQEKLSELKSSLSKLQGEYKEAGTDSEKLADYQKILDSIDEQAESKRLETEQLNVQEQEASKAMEREIGLSANDQTPVQSPSQNQNTEEIKTDEEINNDNIQPETEELSEEELLKGQLTYINSEWQKAQDEQGIFGKMVNGVKNLFKTEYSSKKINTEVETLINKYQNGEEISQDEILQAYNKIETYKAKQDSAVNKTTTFGAILTGSIAGAKAGAAGGAALGSVVPGAGTAAGAVVGGICGFVAGAFAGAFAKTGLEQLENVTDSTKGNSFKLDDMKQDAIAGAKLGGFSGATAGISSGIKAFKEAKAFALSEPEVLETVEVLDKDGNVIQSFRNSETGSVATQQAGQNSAQTAQQAGELQQVSQNAVQSTQDVGKKMAQSAPRAIFDDETQQNPSVNSIANGIINPADTQVIINEQGASTSSVFDNQITDIDIPDGAPEVKIDFSIDSSPIDPANGEVIIGDYKITDAGF